MPNIKLISIALIVLFWLAFARTPVVLVSALTDTLSPALADAKSDTAQTTNGSCKTRVHKTGETKCYDKDNNEVSCEDNGVTVDTRFTEEKGVVTDKLTGLMWLKNANCADPDPNKGIKDQRKNDQRKMNGAMTWKEALQQVDNLNDNGKMRGNNCGDQNNYKDWRLPNVNELESLISYGELVQVDVKDENGKPKKEKVALPSGHSFTNVQSYYYWPSSTLSGNTDDAWSVHLKDGRVFRGDKSYGHYVWPVRVGQ